MRSGRSARGRLRSPRPSRLKPSLRGWASLALSLRASWRPSLRFSARGCSLAGRSWRGWRSGRLPSVRPSVGRSRRSPLRPSGRASARPSAGAPSLRLRVPLRRPSRPPRSVRSPRSARSPRASEGRPSRGASAGASSFFTSLRTGAGAGTGAGVSAMPNRFLIQPNRPVSAGAGAGTGAGGGALAATGATATGLGGAIGAGASGSTPLMMGSCLLCFSWLRRVTVVASSASSASL